MTNYTARDMADLRLQFGGRCQECGAPHSRLPGGKIGPLEFAHKNHSGQGKGRGLNNRFNEIKQHPERFVLLCWRCHRRFDRTAAIQELESQC